MPVSNLIPEKIEIVDFKIIKGKIESPFEFETSKITGHQFNASFNTSINLKNKLVKADFIVSIETVSENKETEKVTGEFHFVFVFHVQNIDELISNTKDKKSQSITVDGLLGNALASITYSTSRGILMTRFQGTPLSSFILPVVNPNDLLD